MLRPQPPQTPVARPTPWMTTADTAAYLGVTELTLREYMSKHGLPSYQPGGRGAPHRFNVNEVDAWMETRKRTISCFPNTPGSADAEQVA